MKNKIPLFGVLVAIILTISPVMAKRNAKNKKEYAIHQQAAKKEQKEWKRRKDAMDPLQLKELIEENHTLRMQKKQDIEQLKEQQQRITQLAKEITEIEEKKLSPDPQPQVIKQQDTWQQGLVFKVQIGAYKERDLRTVLAHEEANPADCFEQETQAGIQQYTLRHFRNYWQANAFKKEIRAMGVKDAWIAVFSEGKRIPLKEVLPIVLKQPK